MPRRQSPAGMESAARRRDGRQSPARRRRPAPARQVLPARPLVQHRDGEEHGEEGLGLHHGRAQAGGMPSAMPVKSRPNCAIPSEEADGHHPPPIGVGRSDEQEERQRCHRETQCREQKRRKIHQAEFRRDEIAAPDDGAENGGGDVERRHWNYADGVSTSMMAGLRAGQELAAMPATISAQPTHFIGLTVSPTTTTLVLMPNRGTSSA